MDSSVASSFRRLLPHPSRIAVAIAIGLTGLVAWSGATASGTAAAPDRTEIPRALVPAFGAFHAVDVDAKLPADMAPAADQPDGPEDPSAWITDEFQADWGLEVINAHHAYARGLSGAGVRLGLLDSGAGFEHPEFAGKDHRSLVMADLLADGTRCSDSTVLAGPGACFYSEGDRVALNGEYWDPILQNYFPHPDNDYLWDNTFFSYNNHGTHVAGTIAANRDGSGMHGVAFGADLSSARLFNDSLILIDDWCFFLDVCDRFGTDAGSTAFVHMYEQAAEHGVQAMNHSWGYTYSPYTPDEVELYHDLLMDVPDIAATSEAMADASRRTGMIQVFAAGNSAPSTSPEDSPHPTLPATLPMIFPDIEQYWVSVVNLTPDLELGSQSMKCGVTADWCIAAPGSDVTSTVLTGDEDITGDWLVDSDGNVRYEYGEFDASFGYADYSGTSMAAPHVTGALGLLFERFPYLTGVQVRDVMLTTATDIGEEGVDDVYGWGLLNLAKAIEGPALLRADTEVVMDQRAGGTQVWEGDAWDDWTNDIGGPGHLTKAGAGWLRLSGDNTFAGATVDQGVLEFSGANTLAGDLGAAGGGRLLVSGTGSLAAGTLDVAAAGIQVDGTVLLAGDALLDDGALGVGQTGSLAAARIWLAGGTADIRGDLEAARFDAAGTSLQVGGNVSIAGETAIEGGGLTVGGGGLFQSGETTIAATNVLVGSGSSFDVAGLSFSGGEAIIAGEASLLDALFRDSTLGVLAGGTLEVTGLHLVGTDALINGTLSGGHTLVDADSSLRGAGTLGDTTVEGLVSPGNSIGTLHIEGDYVQAAGSTFEAELLPPDNADLLSVSGTATIEGGTLRAIAHPGQYLLGQTYTIIAAAGGLGGEFDVFETEALSPFLQMELVYQANGMLIGVLPGNPLASAAGSYNQFSAATALDALPIDQGLLVPLTQLSPEQAMEVVDQLSGEAHAGVQAAMIDSSRLVRNAALARAMNGQDGFSSQRDAQANTGAWVEVHRQGGRINADGNAAQLRHSSSATLVGIDHQFDGGWRVGALGGIGRTDFDIRQRRARGEVDSRHLGAYGARSWGGFGLRAGYTYAWHEVDTERRIRFPGFSDDVSARYDATGWQAVVEGGYRFGNDAWEVEPYLQYAHVSVDADGFVEDGGPAALRGSGADARVDLSTVGVRFGVKLGGSFQQQTWLSLRGNVGYRHAGGDQVRNALLGWDGSEWFNVRSPAVTDEGMLLELGVAARTSANTLFEVGYSGVLSDDARDHGASARFSWQF